MLSPLRILPAFLLLSALALFSAIPTYYAGQRIKSGELKSKYCFSIADWDGNGKKDILFMSAGGDRPWAHLNQGTDAAPSFGFAERIILNLSETTPDAVTYTTSLQVLDWDGDNDLDWLVCDNTAGVMLVTNTGSRTAYTLSKGDIILSGQGFFTAFGVDWDKDGKRDILVYSGNKLTWRKNSNANTQLPSFGSARTFKTSASAAVDEPHAFSADWNNDGFPDIITCGALSGDYTSHPYTVGPKTVRLYLGTANLDSLTGPSIIPNVAGGSRLSVTDWNNDGKKDILVMDSALAVLRLYLNTGTDAAPAFSAVPDTVTGTDFNEIDEGMQTQWLDWNKDGRMDVVISGNYNSHCSGMQPLAKLYLNTAANGIPVFKYGAYLTCGGTPVKWEWNGSATSQAVVRDFNHDGNWDLYLSVWRYSSGNPCDLFYYAGNAATATSLAFASETNCGYGKNGAIAFLNPAAGDLDNDGLDDLVMAQPGASNAAAIAVYRNTGSSGAPLFSDANRVVLMTMDASLDGISSNPFVNDLDKDGKPDLVMGIGLQQWGGESSYGVRYYPNTGTAAAPAFTRANSSPLMLKSGGRVALPAPENGHITAGDARKEFRTVPVVVDCDNDGLDDLAVAFGVDHGAFNVWSTELWLFRNGAGTGSDVSSPRHQSNSIAAFPNPFVQSTRITFKGEIAASSAVFGIYNASGREVARLNTERWNPVEGTNWDAGNLPSGLYLLRCTINGKRLTKQLILSR